VRVDVPETDQADRGTTKPYTKLIGVGSIYCITPTTEEVARRCAQQLERYNNPIPVELPVERRLTAGVTSDAEMAEGDGDGDDDYESDWEPPL
jgi:hypothetical protein